MTGQRFSEEYRRQILGKHGSRFDSESATLALTAVSLTEPQRELELLNLMQEARYVQAQDITSIAIVAKLLQDAGLAAAADLLVSENASTSACTNTELRIKNNTRLQHAQQLLQIHGITGVPNIIVKTNMAAVYWVEMLCLVVLMRS